MEQRDGAAFFCSALIPACLGQTASECNQREVAFDAISLHQG